ncbi:hypothetical protein EDB86DRAFT_610240 [Lactarius hatsudake]|nr:hypothetical protein EDB86DRAFT_610240 [Lactarius hatsudake]
MFSRFICADLHIEPSTVTIELVHHQSSFYLSVQQEAMGHIVSQVPIMHSNVDCLTISLYGESEMGNYVQWLELFRPFASVRTLGVSEELAWNMALALKNVTEEMAAQVLPALELLYLENQPEETVKKFLAARQSLGRPITFVNKKGEVK